MVDPISDEERLTFNHRVKLGTAALVGASAGLITLQVQTTALQTVGAVVFGLLVGAVLAEYVVPSGPAPATKQRQRQRRTEENPFTDGGDDGSTDDSEATSDRTERARSRSGDRGRR
ncbi:MAG: hypothetical protein ABEI39_04575 [Halobacteriales archaeon]